MILKGFKTRLHSEEAIMVKEMPQFRLYQMNHERYFEGYHTTSTNSKCYKLKLAIPDYYPDEMPKLYIVSPSLLFCRFRDVQTIIALGMSYGLQTINSMGITHAFHTLENGPGGCVQICHFKSALWDASKTCIAVLMKGILWLEAYEVYLNTGMDISTVLNKWKRSQEWRPKKKELDGLLKKWLWAKTWDISSNMIV
jgi:hypothetical protein